MRPSCDGQLVLTGLEAASPRPRPQPACPGGLSLEASLLGSQTQPFSLAAPGPWCVPLRAQWARTLLTRNRSRMNSVTSLKDSRPPGTVGPEVLGGERWSGGPHTHLRDVVWPLTHILSRISCGSSPPSTGRLRPPFVAFCFAHVKQVARFLPVSDHMVLFVLKKSTSSAHACTCVSQAAGWALTSLTVSFGHTDSPLITGARFLPRSLRPPSVCRSRLGLWCRAHPELTAEPEATVLRGGFQTAARALCFGSWSAAG